MELERIREILKNKRFKYTEDLSEQIDEDYFVETYERGEDQVEIYSSSDRIVEVFISLSIYDFKTDESDRHGVNLRENDNNYCLTEETLMYCLEIQEYPRRHIINFCRFYLEFSEWSNKELIPVLNYLELVDDCTLYSTNEDWFSLPIDFSYEGENLYLYLSINPLNFKVSITLGIIGERFEEKSDLLYGELSDIILAAIEDYRERFENRKDPF